MRQPVEFSSQVVDYVYDTSFSEFKKELAVERCIVITDEHVHQYHSHLFAGFKSTIVLRAGEEHKTIDAVLSIVEQLLSVETDRQGMLIGVGGGLVTDIVGFVASAYMRGVKFGFVPTSILGMVDASIGGKNGVNYKLQKNLLGTINQPQFILFDTELLETLPVEEWSNGFAEVIKYGCLYDVELFKNLINNNINSYRSDSQLLSTLLKTCADWKNKVVIEDEHEAGVRKLLNFGHTVGHAIETVNKIPHGHAVGIGMLIACKLSEQFGLNEEVFHDLKTTLQHYHLPTNAMLDKAALMHVLQMDKKRNDEGVDFIILKQVGQAEIQHITFDIIEQAIEDFIDASNN